MRKKILFMFCVLGGKKIRGLVVEIGGRRKR